MATTYFATSDPSVKKHWEKGVRMEMEETSLMGSHASESGDKTIEINRLLQKNKGDNITFTLLRDCDDQKVYTSNETIEGKEQAIQTFTQAVTLETYDLPISAGHELSNQRVDFEIPDKTEMLIKRAGSRFIDRKVFETLTGASTSDVNQTPGDFTKMFTPTETIDALGSNILKIQALTAADKINMPMISRAKAFARVGGYVYGTGLRKQPRMPSLKLDGQDTYLVFIHPDVGYDMRQDSQISEYLKDAHVRGTSNPIFNGASFMLDGLVFVETDLVPIRAVGGAGSNVPYALNFMVGAQALLWAWGREPQVFQYKTDAYGRFVNYALSMMAGWTKSKYNSLDFSVIGLPTARTNINGLAS